MSHSMPVHDMLVRAASGGALAVVIAGAAHRAKALDTSGALAAIAVGTATTAAGWNWGALLLLYFIISTLISRVRRAERETLTASIIEKGGARDATQVIANGGIFAASALLAPFGPPIFATAMAYAAVAALAASAADTWATEIGTVFGGIPRSLRGFTRVPRGTSGAVSAAGMVAMVAGAFFVAIAASWLSMTPRVGVIIVAGISGAFCDSIVGALWQVRRRCNRCGVLTERVVHECGTHTVVAGGHGWLDNDSVNLLSTFVGATVAAILASL
jgi:uncharacterized protein (TIGR00297 family)